MSAVYGYPYIICKTIRIVYICVEKSVSSLLCCKLRDYTAQKLEEGDIDDSQCRQIIVRELDDIKTKLDDLSRNDLLASLSFFKERVTRLYISLETYAKSCDN